MTSKGRRRAKQIARVLNPQDYGRFIQLKLNTSDFGYDSFGLELESAMLAFAVLRLIYKHWFRVESSGLENVPREGPVLIAPNHSGAIPIDGAMVCVDLAAKLDPPRVARSVVDNFSGFLPFVSTFFFRCGQVVGARNNLTKLLGQGEMVCVFPEGHKGTGKPFRERYHLTPFNVGFVELSLLHKAPIVPTAIIGAEEQYPYTFNIRPLAKAFKFPYFPMTPLPLLLGPLGLLPLPTKYQIRYGEPIRFYQDYPPETIRDPDTVRGLAETVRSRVQQLVRQELALRKGVFGASLPSAGRLFSAASRMVPLAKARLALRKRIDERFPEAPLPADRPAAPPAPEGARAVLDPRLLDLGRLVKEMDGAIAQRIGVLESAVEQLRARINQVFRQGSVPPEGPPEPEAEVPAADGTEVDVPVPEAFLTESTPVVKQPVYHQVYVGTISGKRPVEPSVQPRE